MSPATILSSACELHNPARHQRFRFPQYDIMNLTATNMLNTKLKDINQNMSAETDNLLAENLDSLDISDEENLKKSSKRVKFADAVGLELEHIRHITAGRDTPPDLCPSIIASLMENVDPEKPKSPTLTMTFKQPVSDYIVFKERLNQNSVSLESVSVDGSSIVGILKVKNLSYLKSVFVRLTLDNWKTHTDVPAYYLNSGITESMATSSSIDTFTFQYDVPLQDQFHKTLQFAVCFCCEGHQYWDNNNSSNYRIAIESSKQNYQPSPLANWRPSHESSYNANWSEYAIWHSCNDSIPYW